MSSHLNINLEIDLSDPLSMMQLRQFGMMLSGILPDPVDVSPDKSVKTECCTSPCVSVVDSAEDKCEEPKPEEPAPEDPTPEEPAPEEPTPVRDPSPKPPSVSVEPMKDGSREEKERFRRDRMDLLRKAVKKVYSQPGSGASADTVPKPSAIPGLPKKSFGQKPMEAFVESWSGKPGVSVVRRKDGFASGTDYVSDGRAVTLHRIFSDGVCVVAIKGTRYYRAMPLESLSHMFPAKACPKYAVDDPKRGDEVYVGLGLREDEFARSFRKAVIDAVKKNGAVEVRYVDNDAIGTCGIAQLSSKPLVR